MKKEPVFEGFDDLLKMFNGASYLFDTIFSHTKFINPVELGVLGQNVYLIPLDIKENKERNMRYGKLYKEDPNGNPITVNEKTIHLRKLSNDIFRVGGMASGFKDRPYCELIYYKNVSTDKNPDLGTHCLIDTEGKIVFKCEGALHYPHYYGGVIVSCNNVYYNLKTGQPFAEGHHSIKSSQFIFVECSSYRDKFPKGVYKINIETGDYEIFD